MPNPFRFLACLVLAASLGVGAVETGTFRRTLPSETSQEYWLRVPANYDPQRKYPLYITVHGMGGNGKSFVGLWNTGDLKLDPNKPISPNDFIFLGPTFTGSDWFRAEKGTGKKLDEMFDLVVKEYSIDRENVFLHGFSGGGAFAWTYLWLHNTKEKNYVTAGVVLTGANCWRNIRPDKRYPLSLPFFIEVGDGEWNLADLGADGTAADANLKGAGYESVVFHKIEGQGHSIGPKSLLIIFEWLHDQLNRKVLPRVKDLEARLAAARADHAAGAFSKAYSALAEAASLPDRFEAVKQALDLRKQIEAACASRLAEADSKMAAKDLAAGAGLYATVAEGFRGVPGADLAAAKLKGLEGDASLSSELAKQKKEAAGRTGLEAAQKAEKDGKLAEALSGYERVVKDFAATDAGRKAEGEAKRIRADGKLMARLKANRDGAQAGKMLKAGRELLEKGQREEARDVFKMILNSYPETPQAQEAKELLGGA